MEKPLTIGSVVRCLRKARGLSQRKVESASAGEINRNWLASLEKENIKNPPQTKLSALAEILGTTVAEIYREAGIIVFPSPDGTTSEERQLIDDYRAMTRADQRRARIIMRDLREAYSVEDIYPNVETEDDAARAA